MLARLAGSAVNNNRGSAAIISIVTHLIVYQPRHTSYDAEIQQASTNRRAGSLVKSKSRIKIFDVIIYSTGYIAKVNLLAKFLI